MIKLVIFDLDGTLVNSIFDLAEAANYALKKNGFPLHEEKEYNYFVGDGVPKLIERSLPDGCRNYENIQKLHFDFSEYYNIHYAYKTKPYDGIIELLDILESDGIKTAVASNKPDEFTKLIIDKFFGVRFSDAAGNLSGVPKKPNPQIVFNIMDRLSVCKEDTVFIGDSNIDIITAKNAGLKSIGCLWGFRTYEELSCAGADFIINNPSEIPDIIKNL